MISITILAFFIAAAFAGSAPGAEAKKTVTGVVTEGYQIITDNNEVYDVADNEIGDRVLENTGKKVKVTGTFEYDEDTDARTITIESFTVIGEADPEVEPADENETDTGMEFEADTETDAEMEAAE